MMQRGPGCAICDGFGGMQINGAWQVCPNCKDWPPHPPTTMTQQHTTQRGADGAELIAIPAERWWEIIEHVEDVGWNECMCGLAWPCPIGTLMAEKQSAIARLEAAERVIEEARRIAANRMHDDDLPRLVESLIAYDATRSTEASEEDAHE